MNNTDILTSTLVSDKKKTECIKHSKASIKKKIHTNTKVHSLFTYDTNYNETVPHKVPQNIINIQYLKNEMYLR